MADIEKLLKSHDWYFTFADSLYDFNRGRIEREDIVAALEKLPVETALALWVRFAPMAFPFPLKKAA